jgi:hypothetical protein
MKNQNLLGFGMIATAIVAGGALVGRAGDVNPPAGPVNLPISGGRVEYISVGSPRTVRG